MSSSRLNLFFVAILVLLAAPVLASQSAIGIVQNSSHVDQSVNNYEIGIGKVGEYIDNSKSSSTTTITFEAPVETIPDINLLGVGDVDESILMYPGEVLSWPTAPNTTFFVKSAIPIAVYTIGTGNDRMLLESSESILTYDPLYHRFDHGVVAPLYVFPHFTTKCQVTTDSHGYIVLDNRYFPDYTMIEIRST